MTGNMQRFMSRKILGKPQVPKLALWLIKKDMIKNGSWAKMLFWGIFIFNIVATILILIIFFKIL